MSEQNQSQDCARDARRAQRARLRQLHRAGEHAAALSVARDLTQTYPQDDFGWTVLAQLHERARAWPEAVAAARQLTALLPASDWTHAYLGLLLKRQGLLVEATTALRRALELAPERAETHNLLGLVLIGHNLLQEAEAALRRAVALDPTLAAAWSNLGTVLRDLDRQTEAIEAFRQALRTRPDYPVAHSNLLFSLAFVGETPPAELRAAAQRWEAAALTPAARAAARAQRFERAPLRARPLRLGILSAELGHHPVACFLEPWLAQLDPRRVVARLYPTKLYNDAHARALRALAADWIPLLEPDDAQAVARLRAEQLDVLIDTSGHMVHHRLSLIARRVAPVQCHYIGYFATTGLSEMDYFIGDAVLIPPEHDDHFVETVWRLPRSRYAYTPLADAPTPRWQPDPAGTLWLGSFNNLTKVRDASLALWAGVLHALPEAKLLLKDRKGSDPATQERIHASVARHGIDPGRVVFLGHVPDWRAHMALYDRLDLALDTVPFNSATTGFEALWMGVPLLTLAGDALAGRQAASLLAGLGQRDWIARDAADFTRIAVALARAVDERRRLRSELRSMMRHGELCDGAGLARALEEALIEMFARWQTRPGAS